MAGDDGGRAQGGKNRDGGRGRGRGRGRGGRGGGRNSTRGGGAGRKGGRGQSRGGGNDQGRGRGRGNCKSPEQNSSNESPNNQKNDTAKDKQTPKKKNEKDASKNHPPNNQKNDTAKDKQKPKKKNEKDNSKNEQKKVVEGKRNKPKNESSSKKSNNNKKQDGKKSSPFTPLTPSAPPNQPQLTNDINYGRGEKITVLHIAEKPSIAQAIARGLSGPADVVQKGKSLPVHEFTHSSGTSTFPKAPNASSCRHRVTSVAGHVFSVDFPPQFQSWDSVDPAELFTAPVVKKPCKGSVVKHLQDEARGVDFMVLWMDCDREGENINFEVLDCCLHLMKHGGNSNFDRVYRAYFSAINPSDIKKAYNALGKPDKNQALSVDARQELDLKVGVAFSRFQTRFFQGRYGDLDSAVLSYGPCQTPTLGFCVQRHVAIETFTPEPYWTLDLKVLKRGHSLHTTWGGGRSFNRNKVEALVTQCTESDSPVLTVTKVVTKEKKQGRPIPLNTVALLKACSKALGIGPHQAMQTAERLYLSGYLSYPRTESSTYPKSFDIRGTLQQQSSDHRWGNYVQNLLANGHNKSRGGVDMGDHPPITPCRSSSGELSGDMARVYEFVVRHFIASVSQDAVWRSTRVDFELEPLKEKGKFSVSGKELVDPGFLAVLLHREYGNEGEHIDGLRDEEEDEEERAVPEFKEGEVIPLVQDKASSKGGSGNVTVAVSAHCWASLGIKEKMTTAPSHLTESELISLMEKHEIGTDASIATHIENIQKRNYVALGNNRKLVPSKLGLVLVQGYHQIDSGLVLPKIRSDIEGQCNKIAKGLADRDTVVKKAIEVFLDKFQFFVKNIDKMDILFGSSFAKLEDVGKPFTRCGNSRRYLQYIPGPPARLYNKFTETVYPLPAGGNVKQWTGRKCTVPDCDFELCLYSCGQPPRTFPLCPNCYNNSDWSLDSSGTDDPIDREDEHKEKQIQKIAGKTLVLECPLPDHHPLIEEMTVSPDPDSDGVLILDPHLGPKWRLVSTRNPTIVHLPKSIDKLTVMNKADDVLGCHYMKIDFKAGESPLEGGELHHECCYPTDEIMQGVSRVYHGSDRLKATGRGRGRGGRGRDGRGGRGRGRGRR
mmetsp:Transcript_23723/g.35898  ORF Transcript_23723/g.35898 Transcript_23723/m.35898 type:complete len:1111 (-) Transcript_23723:56-3388(-)